METTSIDARLRFGLPILALAFGLFLALQPLLTTGLAAVPGGLGDARLVHFSLEHAHRFVVRDASHLDLWDPPLFYPARNIAAHTDVLLSLTPFYSPWRLLGAAPDTAFQLWLVVVWALNFGAFQLFLVRVLRLDPVPAAAGAYLFAFGSPRVVNVTHPQLIPWFYVVLALYALWRTIELDGAVGDARSRRRVWIGVFFLALVLQLYGAFYPLFFFAFVIGLATLLGMCWPASRRRLLRLARDEAPVLAGAAVVAAILAAPLLERYLLAARTLGLRSWSEIEPLLPRWQSWLLMGHDNWLYGWIYGTAVWPQREYWRSSAHASGLGVVATACALAGLWHYRRRISTRLLVGLSLLVVLLTTLWPGGLTLWRLCSEVLPGAGGIRAVGRIGMMLLIPAGIGVAYFFQRRLRKRQWVAAVLLGFLMLVEQGSHIPSYDKQENRSRIQTIASGLEADCQSFLLTVDGRRPHPWIHEDAMWVALDTGVPTINGRYGNEPPGWPLRRARRWVGDSKGRRQLEDALSAWSSYNCMDPADICWIETDGESAASPRRPQIARRDSPCSR